jgi:GMC oxidoreductase
MFILLSSPSVIGSHQVVVATGSCMGGATSINQGIWILETPQWLIDNVNKVAPGEDFFDEATIDDAYKWVTEVGTSRFSLHIVFSLLTERTLLNV